MNPVSLRRWALGCALAGLSLLLFGGAWVAWARLPERWDFTSARWRFARAESRTHMARDWIAHRSLGAGLQQVLDELGEPERSSGDYWEYAVSFAGLGQPGGTPRYSDEPVLVAWFEADGHRLARFTALNLRPVAPASEFDATLWRGFEHFRDQRQPLALALVNGTDLRGASHDEVRAALGTPDFGEQTLEYVIGRASSTDLAYLVITIDAYDRVASAELVGVGD